MRFGASHTQELCLSRFERITVSRGQGFWSTCFRVSDILLLKDVLKFSRPHLIQKLCLALVSNNSKNAKFVSDGRKLGFFAIHGVFHYEKVELLRYLVARLEDIQFAFATAL